MTMWRPSWILSPTAYGGNFRFHKLLLFNGSGRNGKGVTTQLITRFLGRQNVSNETLHRIIENRFATAKLFGKMANIDADMSSQALRHTGILKMLTGGDDLPPSINSNPLSVSRITPN